ncbi:DNA-binding transcriptional regulator, MerR family [Lachnospiraceae bacterium]|nr:DNA-binding transcriptional regulator, MerR family [Lachnospiraceae bacterium]
MLKIGDFSKLSRVSVRMLRHYDDIGLLKPAEIDDFSGYRYYREEQLFIIGRITTLKDMGFALADIIRILEIYDDKDKFDDYLITRQKELADQARETEYKLMLLDTARKRLRKGQNMSYDVTVKTIPERYAATVHMIIPRYEDEQLAWNRMKEYGKPMTPADPCRAGCDFLDKEYKEENVEIVAWMTVKGKYEDTEQVEFKILPEIEVASCIVKGSYDQLSDATATALSWINSNGYKMSDSPMFCIYHVSPAMTSNPDEYVTEVCFPVERS